MQIDDGVKMILGVAMVAMTLAGCKDPACEKIGGLISKANLAIRDEDPAAMREVSEEMKPVVAESKNDVTKGLPRRLEQLAAAAEAEKTSEEEAAYSASRKGFDVSADIVVQSCE